MKSMICIVGEKMKCKKCNDEMTEIIYGRMYICQKCGEKR